MHLITLLLTFCVFSCLKGFYCGGIITEMSCDSRMFKIDLPRSISYLSHSSSLITYPSKPIVATLSIRTDGILVMPGGDVTSREFGEGWNQLVYAWERFINRDRFAFCHISVSLWSTMVSNSVQFSGECSKSLMNYMEVSLHLQPRLSDKNSAHAVDGVDIIIAPRYFGANGNSSDSIGYMQIMENLSNHASVVFLDVKYASERERPIKSTVKKAGRSSSFRFYEWVCVVFMRIQNGGDKVETGYELASELEKLVYYIILMKTLPQSEPMYSENEMVTLNLDDINMYSSEEYFHLEMESVCHSSGSGLLCSFSSIRKYVVRSYGYDVLNMKLIHANLNRMRPLPGTFVVLSIPQNVIRTETSSPLEFELTAEEPVAYHRYLYMTAKTSIFGNNELYSILQVWGSSDSKESGMIQTPSLPLPSHKNNWRQVLHALSHVMDRIDLYFAYILVGRSIVRKDVWLLDYLQKSVRNVTEVQDTPNLWKYSTILVAQMDTLENAADTEYRSVQRRGMPIRIIQIQDASMGPPSEVSLVTTGADRLSFLIPSEYVRGDLNNTFAACLEALDCDMNAETGRDIHSITAQCENNACQEQRIAVMEDGYSNPVMYLNWTPHDDPGQLISLVKNQFYVTEKAVASTTMKIVENMFPPDVVGNPDNVRARRVAAIRLLPYATGDVLKSVKASENRNAAIEYILGPKSSLGRLVCSADVVIGMLDGMFPGDKENHLITTSDSDLDQVTIGMTTCRRLVEFVATVEALLPALGYFVGSDGYLCGASDATVDIPISAALSVQRPHKCMANCSFVFHPYVAEVVVVDDMSSAIDRMTMMSLYPMFSFIMKPARLRGHANSLNLLLNRVRTRFFVYLEDDWKLLAQPYIEDRLFFSFQEKERMYYSMTNNRAGNMYRNSFAMAVLAAVGIIKQSFDRVHTSCTGDGCEGREPVVEVLFNDQGTSCSARGFNGFGPKHPYFNRYKCKMGTTRQNAKFDDQQSQFHYNYSYSRIDSVLEEIGASGWERSVLSLDGVRIPYQLHEFGLASTYHAYSNRLHGHSVWPGFSLNPGVWDLYQIKRAFGACMKGAYFNPDDMSFEHEFSLSIHMLGLSIAYLPSLFFEHIGEKASAYVLNNSSRIWDNNSTQLKELGFLYETGPFPD